MPILTCWMEARSLTATAWSLSESKFTRDAERGADLPAEAGILAGPASPLGLQAKAERAIPLSSAISGPVPGGRGPQRLCRWGLEPPCVRGVTGPNTQCALTGKFAI
jgi:hypothetical protein